MFAPDWLLPEGHLERDGANDVAGAASPGSLLVTGLIFAVITAFFVVVRL